MSFMDRLYCNRGVCSRQFRYLKRYSLVMRSFILCLLFLGCSGFTNLVSAAQNHVILCGGPALRKWEDLRIKKDQHDRWWANFIRASTIRMDEIRKVNGNNTNITWIVYRDGYVLRGKEDGKPYTTWIKEQAVKRRASLVWVNSGKDAIGAINNHPSNSVVSFDFFGHSNKYCFLLDYSADIMGSSKAWVHETDLYKVKRNIFAKTATCQSWGCHSGESMNTFWKQSTGVTLVGAKGKTSYEVVGQGILPLVSGHWVR